MSTVDKRREPSSVLLEISGLTIEGHSNDHWAPIVDGVSLSVARGEVLGLIGESGAGKSTLGLAAMGFVRDGCRVADGGIEFDGIDVLAAGERRRRVLRGRRIAYVAQSAAASFNPAHRLIDQYAETPVRHRVKSRAEAERDAKALYARMRLPDPDGIGFRYPHQVSGGQLQRAMTAMAMACRPDLIVFDEPTTALDVTTQIEVLSSIRDIVAEFGTAAIYISHDLAVVAQMADRVMVLLDGREIETADTRTMLFAPVEPYTRSLWAVRDLQRSPRSPVAAASPLLSLRAVGASYGETRVLDDVSFDLHAGRTVAMVGESGSGKSTVARVITGLLPPESGEVTFDGIALPSGYRRRSRDQLRQIQMIYQMADTALNPRIRIRDLVGRPAQMYLGLTGSTLTDRTRELLSLIGLEPDAFMERLPVELSGGQKQRIGIARALAAEPRLIICDEVTSALDQIVAEGILRLLDDLQTKLSLTYLFIAHDLSTVRAVADEVVVMKDGSIVEQGTVAEVFRPPAHPYTELLLSSVPEMDPDWLDELLQRRDGDRDRPA